MNILGLDDDELISCVGCGLCLPHCPTYRVTGLEIASPRGRIAAMRAVETGVAPIDAPFVDAMQECVQCRGCEAACPSGVPFGHLMEDTRAALELNAASRPTALAARVRRGLEWIGYRVVLPNHRVLIALSWLLLVAQRLHLVPKRFGPQRFGPPLLTRSSLMTKLDVSSGALGDAWLFTGCVMDAWQRPTHLAALQVLQATGLRVAVPGRGGDCCGALHEHAGRRAEAQHLARKVMQSMPGDAPIVVDSAGCGAALKQYGRLLGTEAATDFSRRVFDFSEFVVQRGVPATRATGRTVVVQDPCHLRHVQKSHMAVRSLLSDGYELVDTDDDGLCCGAGGAYSVLQPDLSREIAMRKSAALRAAGADRPGVLVCSANPGCAMQLTQAGFSVQHPAELLRDALKEGPR